MREIKKFVPRRRRANLVWVAVEYDYTVYDFAPIHRGDLPALMSEYRIAEEGQAGQREKFRFEVEECGIKVIYDGTVYKGVTYNLLVATKIIDLTK